MVVEYVSDRDQSTYDRGWTADRRSEIPAPARPVRVVSVSDGTAKPGEAKTDGE